MSKRSDERIKLFATLLNNMANGCFVVGIAAPTAAVFYKTGAGSPILMDTLMLGASTWFAAMVVLHLGAHRVLGGLKDE